MNLDDLDPEDALALRIGRMAREHVRLDQSLRYVHKMLMMPGLGAALTNRVGSTIALISECNAMLEMAGLEESVLAGCTAALEAASGSNNDRNRVVHDMWLRDASEALNQRVRWNIGRVQKSRKAEAESPRDLDYVGRALARIGRTNIRVLGMSMVLPLTLSTHAGLKVYTPVQQAREVERYIKVMLDQFTVLDTGVFQIHGGVPGL